MLKNPKPHKADQGKNPAADTSCPQKQAETGCNPVEKKTDLQEKAARIAAHYRLLPLQDKINVIARTFGSNTGKFCTVACGGKWSGTSDMFIRLENETLLFIGNCRTSKAKNAKTRNQYIDKMLERFNPLIVKAAKEAAFQVLLRQEQEDNKVAAQKGLKPYRMLGVELADGGMYTGWYYVTLEVGGKIRAHIEANLSRSIESGETDFRLSKTDDYRTAGGIEKEKADYVFRNIGFSSVSEMYSFPLPEDVRKQAEVALAERMAGEQEGTHSS